MAAQESIFLLPGHARAQLMVGSLMQGCPPEAARPSPAKEKREYRFPRCSPVWQPCVAVPGGGAQKGIAPYLEALEIRKRLAQTNSETWIFTNLATALLFQGRYQEAEPLYQQLKGQPYDEERSWTEVFLACLEELEAAGITHPDVEKVRELLNN